MPCPKYLVEDLAAQYTTYKATELTFVDWIRLHPAVTVWVLLIFGWLLTTMAVTMVHLSARKKAQKADQEKAEEMAELAEHAQAANIGTILFTLPKTWLSVMMSFGLVFRLYIKCYYMKVKATYRFYK